MKLRPHVSATAYFLILLAAFTVGMAFSFHTYANADLMTASDESTDVPVTLTTQAASFSATVPTVLPYCSYTDGTVMNASCLKIINRCLGQIEVKQMVVELPDGWGFSSSSGGGERKVIRLIIQGKDVPGTGQACLKNFEAVDGESELPLCIEACCGGSEIEDAQIQQAKITIILGWNKINNEKEKN